MTAIETEGLTRRYGDVEALVDLSLSVPEGELFALLGPNGSGKTTTIEILTGQLDPTAGTASVLGHDPVSDPLAVRRSVGILPEREDPPSFLTPREYLEFVGTVRALDDVSGRIDQWADRFEFREKLDTLTTDLSEGERQRVMLAAAFVHEPELVFIDEPLVNLDPLMQEQIKGHFVDYCERGNTVFLSTHFIEVAEELCTQVAIVSDGRLVAERDPRDLDGERLLDVFRDEVGTARAAGDAPDSSAGVEADGGRDPQRDDDSGPDTGADTGG